MVEVVFCKGLASTYVFLTVLSLLHRILGRMPSVVPPRCVVHHPRGLEEPRRWKRALSS